MDESPAINENITAEDDLLGATALPVKPLISPDDISQQKQQLVSEYNTDIRQLISNTLMTAFEAKGNFFV